MIWPFKCSKCSHIEEENRYLKGLVNSLLTKQGIAPVVMAKPKELTPEEKAREEKITKGVIEEYGA